MGQYSKAAEKIWKKNEFLAYNADTRNILLTKAVSMAVMLGPQLSKRCEGVGRLLLHAPGDLISMQDSTLQSAQQVRKEVSENDTPEQLMPAEMYVPNQKQWLTLRAKKMKGPIAFTLCCIVLC